MAIYAIGDVQGCLDELMNLLDKISFNKETDKLWFVGDLVNRGSKSLETLRFIKELGSSAITVLGNHDIHLLVTAHFPERRKRKDTLHTILDAPDCEAWLNWLRKKPLFHYDTDLKIGMLHAGLPPQWDLVQTQNMATIAQQALQADHYPHMLAELYGDFPNVWSPQLEGIEQLRFIFNCFTRMRFCDAKGQLDFKNNGSLGTQPTDLMPWFAVSHRKTANTRLIVGHWAALGFYSGENCFAIDTGCVWGNELTALRLDSGNFERVSVMSSTKPF